MRARAGKVSLIFGRAIEAARCTKDVPTWVAQGRPGVCLSSTPPLLTARRAVLLWRNEASSAGAEGRAAHLREGDGHGVGRVELLLREDPEDRRPAGEGRRGGEAR